MERTQKLKYYVIQFLEFPYKGIDEYVCVPWSWIVLRRKKDQKVVVSYPVENPSDTAKRVKKRQKRSDDWKLYMSDVKYGTDSYEDAKNFINGEMNRDQELSAPVKKKTRRHKRNPKSNHEIGKPQVLVVTSRNNEKTEKKRRKRKVLSALKSSKEGEHTKSDSDAVEHPSQAFECLSESQPSPPREDFPMRKSCSSEISAEESNNRTCVEEKERVENSEQERPSVIQNFSNSTNSDSNPKVMVDPTFFKELFTSLEELHKISANSHSLINFLRGVISDNNDALRDVKQLIVNSRSSNRDIPTTSPLRNTTNDVEIISEMNQSKQQQQQEEYDDHGDDDTYEVSKKRRSRKRKFSLPPEYDENDSRWTLKHRESAPGLVELMPYTNVYINSVALSNCKRLSKDCKSLARMLLVEIFTKSALTICSLTGSRARAYDVEGANIRPGLDENARTVLLAYVEEYGREKKWITVDTSSIQNSLRNKMQEFRSKFG